MDDRSPPPPPPPPVPVAVGRRAVMSDKIEEMRPGTLVGLMAVPVGRSAVISRQE